MRLVPDGAEAPCESGELESPSLFAGEGGPPAFEVKFLLDEERAEAVESLAQQTLALDCHADPARGNSYPITSLYTDTAEFDVYRRMPAAGGCKYRVRRYGDGGPMFVEQKVKDGDRVHKRRAPVNAEQLAAKGHVNWFHEGVMKQGLRPVCRIGYDRVAYLGIADGHTVRVTFDRNIRGEAADGWEVHPVGETPVLLAGQVICEFKFRLAMPGLFKEVVTQLSLSPGTVSKYRRFMQTKLERVGRGDE
jgi:hypothetical protein